MNKKIPADAFTFYVSLGPGRSYETVAAKYGVSKRGVVEHAKRERWQERVARLETRARAQAEEKALESIEIMNERHLQESRFLQSRGLEGLRSGRLELYGASGRLVELGVKLERLIRGQATERSESMEQIVRGEYVRWFSGASGPADSGAGSGPAGDPDSDDTPPDAYDSEIQPDEEPS
jgi:hypothetical protein